MRVPTWTAETHRWEAERLLATATRKLEAWETGEQLGDMLHAEGMAALAAAQVHATLALGRGGQ
jgi:hypothetical protein